ncbi:MAG: DUF421 domain-containing protein [Ruminococcaceae bacterium]|nr:DUF421 domain-containing protein [Oscillospiraceae bacterium]
MITLVLRTFLIYVFLILTMRLMGKRQIGELEVTDLVTTFLLSEIASLPITNQEIPVSFALVPMVILLALEVFSSYILLRIPRLKNLLSAPPTVLIHRGVLIQSALRETRITIEELMSEIRQQNLTDLSQVECAILEKNGKLTVLPKSKYAQPTQEQLGIETQDGGLMHIVYSNGIYSDEGLSLVGRDRAWLLKKLKRKGLEPSRLFCVTANESGKLFWIEKEKKTKK